MLLGLCQYINIQDRTERQMKMAEKASGKSRGGYPWSPKLRALGRRCVILKSMWRKLIRGCIIPKEMITKLNDLGCENKGQWTVSMV